MLRIQGGEHCKQLKFQCGLTNINYTFIYFFLASKASITSLTKTTLPVNQNHPTFLHPLSKPLLTAPNLDQARPK